MTNMVAWTPLACCVDCFSVSPCFRAHRPASPSSFPFSLLLSTRLCLFLGFTCLCLGPFCPRPPRLHQRWQSQPRGLAPCGHAPTCPTRPPYPAPPCSCSLGSGDAPCMSPQPWIVTTRNNRNKVNKSEKK